MPRPGLAPSVALLLVLGACGPRSQAVKEPRMNEIAAEYVKLVLALGEHDADYVDAYLGPEAWRTAARAEALPVVAVRERGERLAEALAELPVVEAEAGRRRGLAKGLDALVARAAMLGGEHMSFDEESAALYDAVAPSFGEEHFQAALERLAARLPGEGGVARRYEAFRSAFTIPPERLDAVFARAVAACREKTLEHLELPQAETFEIEYVTDKSWSGYNWYKGGYHSLIQVNTDLPITIDRALDLACHEGYPGHHVYNLLIERDLVERRGWVEFSVYPLFSPRSLIAEGTANFGIEVAFPAAERVAFESAELFPLAGIDPARAGEFYEVLELARELQFAGNEAARRYLDGEIDAAAAAAWLETYALMSPERARQRVRFIDQYRSYVINYNLGQELVRGWIERRGGTPEAPETRWRLFEELLSAPILPSELES